MRAVTATLLLLLLVPCGAARAQSMKPEARTHFDRGLKLYERQKYDDAIAELRAGLAIDPQPDLLYALGQAERRRGHCDRAVEYYESALALVKDPAAAAAVRVQIERCHVTEGEPKAAPAPTPEPAVLPATAAPPLPPLPPAPVAPPPPPSPPWFRDPLGLSLTLVGIAGAAAGGALMGVAHGRLDQASGSYQQYADARSAPALWTGGIVALAVGGALVVAGVVRLAIVGARHHREAF